MEDNNKTINSGISNLTKVIFLLIVIVVGLISGSLGSFYSEQIQKIPILQKLFFNPFTNSASISQSLPKTSPDDESLVKIVNATSPAVISIVVKETIKPNNVRSNKDGSLFSPFFDGFNFNSLPDNYNQSSQSQNTEPQIVGAGTGFFVTANGLIATNKHVVNSDTAAYEVEFNNKVYNAKIVAKDTVNDIAFLKIDPSEVTPFLSFSSSDPKPGQSVIAIGNSLGQYSNTVTTGIISGIGRSIVAGNMLGIESEQLDGVIQTDAAINPGNSGGPLLNISGEVIGINTAIDGEGQLVGFAIPAKEVSSVLSSYLKNGKITRAYLGIRYIIINEQIYNSNKLLSDQGALIVGGRNLTDYGVMPGGPADKAGLKESDIILAINNEEITEENTIVSMLKNYQPGDVITLKVLRLDGEKEIKLTLGER